MFWIFMARVKRKQVSTIRALNSIFFLYLLSNQWGCAQEDLSNPPYSQHSSVNIFDKKIHLAQKLSNLHSTVPSLLPPNKQVLWQVNGEILYNDRLYDETGYEGMHILRPVPHVKVEIFKQLYGSNEEQQVFVLDEAYTNNEGRFRLYWQAQTLEELSHIQGFILRAYSLQTTPTGHNVEVRSSRQNMLYQLEVEIDHDQFYVQTKNQQPWLPEEIISTDFISVISPREGHLSGAFNILNATALGFEQITKHSDDLASTLTFSWDLDQAVSCGSCYSNNRIRLGGQVEDPDHYDDHIILHEMGHFFTDRWSVDDSPGGPHRGRAVHPSLAYGEGIAYFWSALVLQDPVIVDWMFPEPWVVDLEQNLFNGLPMTWGTFAPVASTSDLVAVSALHHEELVSSLLWSIYQLFLNDDAEWAESLLMDSLIKELPARLEAGSDIGAIGIDFADLLDSLICTLSDEHALNFWLEQIENFSRLRSYSWYWFNAREELCAQKGTQETLQIHFDPNHNPHQKDQNHAAGTLVVDTLHLVDHHHHHFTYQVWLGSPPNTQILAQGQCKRLPCTISLHSILRQGDILKQRLQTNDGLGSTHTHLNLNKLSTPLIVTLTQSHKFQTESIPRHWRGSWLPDAYSKAQQQKLSTQIYNYTLQQNTRQMQPIYMLSEQGLITYH